MLPQPPPNEKVTATSATGVTLSLNTTVSANLSRVWALSTDTVASIQGEHSAQDVTPAQHPLTFNQEPRNESFIEDEEPTEPINPFAVNK